VTSLPNRAGNSSGRRSRSLALVLSLAVGALSIYQAWKSRPGFSEQQIAKAEDEVYETVVREVLPKLGQSPGMRLVFDDKQIVGDVPWLNAESCKTAPASSVQVSDDPPLFDASADTPRELSTNAFYRTAPSPDVVESYRKMRCVGGHLSRTFHTDVPHSFVDGALFEHVLPSAEDTNFARLFPGASGVLGFSHVGFNKRLDEAIVSMSYHCGSLCGGGRRYYLKRVDGRWKTVSKRTTWES